jgi:succinoglycan biosynthesis transport protein ExoP
MRAQRHNHLPLPVPVTVSAAPALAYSKRESNDEDSQGGFSIPQIIAIVRAYWKQSLMIWLGFALVSAIGIKFLPKTYTAIATLIVDTNQKDVLAGQEFPVNLLNNYVATQTELMQGPATLLPVVDKLHLTEDTKLTSGYHGDAAGLRDYTARSLASDLQVDTGRGGQLLYVNASADDPVKAANIANTVTDVYQEQERSRLNVPAGERARHYREQMEELRGKVAAAQERIAAFRQARGITDIAASADAENPDTETQALNSLETHLLDAQNERRSLEAKLAGNRSSTDEAMSSQQVQNLQGELRTLQAQKAQLSAIYGAQHPKLVEVNSRIQGVQQALNSEVSKLGDNNVTQLQRAKSLEEKYTKAVEEQRLKVLKLRDVQGEGGKLVLELESAQAQYKKALDGLDQMMFASAGDYTNVNVVSRATPPSKASKPNKIKLMALALLAGLAAGIGIPFLYELFLNRRLRHRDDMEKTLGIPVLMQFDRVELLAGRS